MTRPAPARDRKALRRAALINTLRQCQLFSGLPEQDLTRIAGICVNRSLNKGECLFRQDDPSRGFYIVQSGSINVHRINLEGREQVIHIFRSGETFAEATLATITTYPADAVALENSEVILVQKTEFLSLLKQSPDLVLRMLGAMSIHLRLLVGRLDDLQLKDVETRLANWLVKRCPFPNDRSPHEIRLTMTKRVLASEVGAASETLSRTFARFREQKLIRVNGKVITVLDPAGLNALLRRHLGEA